MCGTFGTSTMAGLGIAGCRNHRLEKTCVCAWELLKFPGFGTEKCRLGSMFLGEYWSV